MPNIRPGATGPLQQITPTQAPTNTPNPQQPPATSTTPAPPAQTQDSANVNKIANDNLKNDASDTMQAAQLRSSLREVLNNKEPNDVDELKQVLMENAENCFGPEGGQKVFEKLFMDENSSKKYEGMLNDALNNYKELSKDPAKAEGALKNMAEFLAKGAKGIKNGEDDPGC
ncbi:hypothetical protein COW36_14520 [bacterium (Candidatus Blackallbacteria) CG17_big_fil_post_rev_8_21_14_2_50_48_46]|uniref:Uncharacterized protein n=1 Tax=bacterium (Candidatus Blackallbacteria) CG17_big_fil_post_rev_8_21_14_2_50_48_46 TaxID=2014261 RepID=A0A2M7G2A3_9BACT|nr:MAG: hypothetical protein COW64_12030 [bacterium (Candidatus Blackallbacteria) CG18_big_fil_WC_8_21_14_2_50_49_26]PIW15930.1 MAG: hypothetical protein COW36_14520 [bacterium (Candidatus Blackallbacteria) CG17_big_fil_post_rev_8_21_14_2_50_48_46]PIW50342.1 MAG: hypothetical protein COW20_02235 [bacterium (Candidatus Blackallbacteria) CG13_big_fil_rev_8_21_14_2_50_49_14]